MDFVEIFKWIWFLSCCCLLSEQRNIYKREVVEEALATTEALRTPQKYIIKPVQTGTKQSDNYAAPPQPYDDVNFDEDEGKLSGIESQNVDQVTTIEPELNLNESNADKTLSNKISRSGATIPYTSQSQSNNILDDATVAQNNSSSESNQEPSASVKDETKVEGDTEGETISRNNSNRIEQVATEDDREATPNSEPVISTTENNVEIEENVNLLKSNSEVANSVDTATTPTEKSNPTTSDNVIENSTDIMATEGNTFKAMLNSENVLQPEIVKENDTNSLDKEEHEAANPTTSSNEVENSTDMMPTEEMLNSENVSQPEVIKEPATNSLKMLNKEEQQVTEDPENEVPVSNNSITTERSADTTNEPVTNNPELTETNDKAASPAHNATNDSNNAASNTETPTSPIFGEQPGAARILASVTSSATTSAKHEIAADAAVSFDATHESSPASDTRNASTPSPGSSNKPIISPGWFQALHPRPTFSINPGGNISASVNSQVQSTFGLGVFAVPTNWIPNFNSFFSPLNIIESRPPPNDIASIATKSRSPILWQALVERAKSVTDQVRSSQVTNGSGTNGSDLFRVPQLTNNRAQVVVMPNTGQVLHFFFPLRFPLEGQYVTDTLRRNPAGKSLEGNVENREAVYRAKEISSASGRSESEDPSTGKASLMFDLEVPRPIVSFVKGIVETFNPTAN